MAEDAGRELERLVEIMARLRAENGCPWDREQDLRSLRPYLVEETYEVLDEMDRVGYGGSWTPFAEELGDLLFQIVFHAQLAREIGAFQMADVCRAISDKIVSRHPHVFGDVKVKDAEQVLANWAQLKAEEKRRKTGSEGSVLDGVPSQAPALLRAERLSEKASRIGFDWPDLAGVRGKLAEELAELDEAIASNDRDQLEHELGDVLFSVANLARFIHTPAEDALRQANRRFTERFHHVEAGLRARQIPFGGATLDQMEALWQEAKVQERPHAAAPPRAALVALTLPVPAVPRARAFWDALAPGLGWSPGSAGPEARYDAHGLVLVFTQGAAAPGIALDLRAPGLPSAAQLAEQLRKAGATPEQKDGALHFADPFGYRWTYRA